MKALRLPRVKVCGLTHADDVDVALDAGADALGFVHHPASPRHVPATALDPLLAQVGARALRVLVVAGAPRAEVDALLAEHDVDALQLCGDEAVDDARGLAVPVLRRLGVDATARAELDRWRDVAALFVLDHPAAPGGTGRLVDPAVAAALAARAPCLLAGGLDAHNVAAAVARTGVLGADASSRLERSPGRKDPDAVRAFVRAARAALGMEDAR